MTIREGGGGGGGGGSVGCAIWAEGVAEMDYPATTHIRYIIMQEVLYTVDRCHYYS